MPSLRCLLYVCLPDYITSHQNLAITLSAITLSALLIRHSTRGETKNSIRSLLLVGHVFSLAVPPVFFAFTMGCNMLVTGCLIKALLFSIPLVLLLSFVVGYFVTPALFIRFGGIREITECGISGFIKREAGMLGLKTPRLYLLDEAKPTAFSHAGYLSGIFLSVGMFEGLTRKQLEAVVLHELHHIKKRSSLLKFSAFYARLLSPIAGFGFQPKELSRQESAADAFVVERQATSHYLKGAKKTISRHMGRRGPVA